MTLAELALLVAFPFGMVLDDADQETQAINAARFYQGYGRIAALDGPLSFDNPTGALFNPVTIPYLGPSEAAGVIFAGVDYGPGTRMGDGNVPAPVPLPPPAVAAALNGQTDISPSEWSLIKPLYALYVERENARALEISRQQGIEVFGRDVASIESDVQRYETETLPRLSFMQLAETI